jgi:hypothetical protein
MQDMRSDESEYRVIQRVVVHDIRPTTLFGRVVAFVFGILVLAAAFFFSLIFFSIIAAAALVFLAYAWWRSRRVARPGKIIEADWHREIDQAEEIQKRRAR